jgi:protein-disulfide isomerase
VLVKYPTQVKLVVKNYPLAMHSSARPAAIAALAAHAQGKFFEYHQKLFANYASLTDTKLQELAAEISLDEERFKKDMTSPRLQAVIERDLNEGRKMGVRGIPAIFVNGKLLEDRSLRGFQVMIDGELGKKGAVRP